jgi:hypothetical protein
VQTPQQQAKIVAIGGLHCARGVVCRDHDLLNEVSKGVEYA